MVISDLSTWEEMSRPARFGAEDGAARETAGAEVPARAGSAGEAPWAHPPETAEAMARAAAARKARGRRPPIEVLPEGPVIARRPPLRRHPCPEPRCGSAPWRSAAGAPRRPGTGPPVSPAPNRTG